MYIRYGHAQARVRRRTPSGGGYYFQIVGCYLLGSGTEWYGMERNETIDLFCIRFRARVSETVIAEQFESDLVSERGF